MAESSSKRPTPRKPTRRKDAKASKATKKAAVKKPVAKPAAAKKPSIKSVSAKKTATARFEGAQGASSKPQPSIPRPSASSLNPRKALARKKAEKQDQKSVVNQPRERRERYQREKTIKLVVRIVIGVFALAFVALIVYLVLRNSSTFEITKVEFEPTEHVAVEDVENLAHVSAGSTLLNVDTASIEQSLKKNPWVASASFELEFPNTLRVIITEQKVDALVLMSSGTVAWYLGENGAWIEPVMVSAAEGQSVNDAALAIAQSLGCLLITDVPATIEPEAGAAATDSSLKAVQEFRAGFSDKFASKIVCFRAPSDENVSCVLDNGVEVSLGSPDDISQKEKIVESFLEQHQGSVVLINVRIPSSPAFREIDSENVQGGDTISGEQTDAKQSDS